MNFVEAFNGNLPKDSLVIEEMTELFEEAILNEFIRFSDSGGVLGAMDTIYQHNNIQEESYIMKHSNIPGTCLSCGLTPFSIPILMKKPRKLDRFVLMMMRKRFRLKILKSSSNFHEEKCEYALEKLPDTALNGTNSFAALLKYARVCSLGQVNEELYQFGGQYFRNV